MKLLILSDGRMGHINQSIAFAKYLGAGYDIVELLPKYAWSKICTYVLDKLNVNTTWLFHKVNISHSTYEMIVGTGSSTYYMVKVLASKLKIKSTTMMLPKGYKYEFDTIFAQSHDAPPMQKNIIEIPVNFSYIEPHDIYTTMHKSIGIIIGGDNKVSKISREVLKKQLDFIVNHYKGYEIAITTSPRTSVEIEKLVESYPFDYKVIFSKNAINPIPDFLAQCESIFITGDSTSMISEAISYGEANVIVLPLENKRGNKFLRFMETLEKKNYLHIFDGTIQKKNKKIDFSTYTNKIAV